MYKLRDLSSPNRAATPPVGKEHYRVNLPLQMAECEANYLRLEKILGDLSKDSYSLMVERNNRRWLHKFEIIERSRYTVTLLLTQESPYSINWLKMPKLTVRIYLDARIAEVLACEGHRRLRPRYEYPNVFMYQMDEKLQLNRFLGEWLSVCLTQGQSLDDLSCLGITE